MHFIVINETGRGHVSNDLLSTHVRKLYIAIIQHELGSKLPFSIS